MHSVTPISAARRSPAIAAVLSFVWPGLGQLYLRRHRSAAFFAVPVLILLILGVRELLQGPVVLALSMLNSGYALGVAVLVGALALWRAASVVDAYFAAARGSAGRSRAAAGLLAILLVAVFSTHLVAAGYALATYRTDISIGRPIAIVPVPGATPDPAEAPVLSTPAPGTTFTPPAQAAIQGRTTILLVGVDFGPGRTHALTDTMLVVSVDTDTKKAVMVSVPRDTTMFPLYWNGATLGPTFKLNALTTGVADRWFHAPDDPMTTLKKEVGYIIGIPVDYYASMDLTGFSEMVDIVGGVDVVNPRTIVDTSEHRTWPAGKLQLDGASALAYVRSRYGDNDYARASRQQDVLVALEKKLATPAMIVQLPSFLALAADTIRTDYPLGEVKDMASSAQGLPPDAIARCVLGPPYSYHPDSSTTNGVWTSRLDMSRVASLSVALFGSDSRYDGKAKAAGCGG